MSLEIRKSPRSCLIKRNWFRSFAICAGALVALANLGCAAETLPNTPSPASLRLDADQIYNLTNIWTIHLKFAPAQWEAMEPKGGGNPFGGGPGLFGSPNGNRTLAPVFMSQADVNRDGKISSEEFAKLAQTWFKAWGGPDASPLKEEQIQAGLDKIRNPAGDGMASMLLAPDGRRNGISSTMGVEFEYVHADLEFEGQQLNNVGVRFKGNGTFMEARDSLKRSLKIDLDKYVKDQNLGKVTTLTLQNNVTDASLMNEVLAYRLYRDAGVPAPRTAYAKVFVTVPGKYERQYLGLYSMTEAVDKQFAERNFNSKKGAIFKPVTPSLFTDLGADWAAYNQIYDPRGNVDGGEKRAVMELSRFVTQADDAEFAARLGEYIDLPEFARYMAVMVYLSDLDGILGPGQNLFLHLHPRSHQIQFIPWDQDHSWGQFNRASQEQRDQLSLLHPWQGENRFLERVFQAEPFKKLYLARLEEFSKSIFEPARIAAQVDQLAAIIRPAVKAEAEAKLARFDQCAKGELLSAPGPFGDGQIKPIKPFAQVRTASVRDQLAGKSQGLAADGGFPGFGGGGGLGGMFAHSLFGFLDANQDGTVSAAEFTEGFARLFQKWNSDNSGGLTLAQVRAGIAQDLPVANQGFSPFDGPRPGGGRGGMPGGRGGSPAPPVAGTKDPGLFQSEHFGMRAFTRAVPNGKYLVKLYFAETFEGVTGPGQRVFSFNVQGREFKDFDIWAKAGGARRAFVESVIVEVTGGELRIAFTPQVENPAINAIEILSQADSGSAAEPIRIKAGQTLPFEDSNGQLWQPDQGFEGGNLSQAGGGGFPGGPGPGPGNFGGGPPNEAGRRANPSARE